MKRISYNNKRKILQLYYNGVPPSVLLREYHISSSTLYFWIHNTPKAAIDSSASKKAIGDISHLSHHCHKLETGWDFARRILTKLPLRDRLAIIDKEYGKESLHVQCEILGVNRGTYLNHRLRAKKDNAWFKVRQAEYESIIKEIYEKSGGVYGARKIAAVMRRKGKIVSDKYVKRLMIELGLRSKRSSADKDYIIVARHLREDKHAVTDFKITSINQIWVSDISVVAVHGRYYYICIFMDLFSRRIVSWNIGKNSSTRLAKRTFMEAYEKRKPKGLTVHTDNGSCYTSYGFEQLLRKLNVCHSYSRPHTPHDNAAAESFFNSLKKARISADPRCNVHKVLSFFDSNFRLYSILEMKTESQIIKYCDHFHQFLP